MREALIRFLDALESIGVDHEEVYDTDVRERLGEAIERNLIAPGGSVDVPAKLGMFSDEADERVVAALYRYLTAARRRADELGLDEAARRTAVWDPEATSTSGATVDEFLGWVD
jgi:hypothetical protein